VQSRLSWTEHMDGLPKYSQTRNAR
jgi:hypothetical protein